VKKEEREVVSDFMIETEELLVEEEAVQKKVSLVLVGVCAFLSVAFIRTGVFSLFFLAPLGFAVLICDSAWFVFFLASALNVGCSIIMRLFLQGSSGSMLFEILYYTTLFFGFTWIMGNRSLRTAYRFVLASALGTVVFLVYVNSTNSEFYTHLYEMSQLITSVIAPSGETDPAIAQRVTEAVKVFLLRGGALFSTAFVFFINRYVSFRIFSIVKKQKKDRSLTEFFAPPFTIWVLSTSLAVILLTRTFRAQLLEILAWNVFVICAIVFLAQGAGILLNFLARRTYVFRILFGVFVVLAFFSPGLNILAVSALLLLGILENWLPLRQPKEGQASTPGS